MSDREYIINQTTRFGGLFSLIVIARLQKIQPIIHHEIDEPMLPGEAA
jgi:hypothetical protein